MWNRYTPILRLLLNNVGFYGLKSSYYSFNSCIIVRIRFNFNFMYCYSNRRRIFWSICLRSSVTSSLEGIRDGTKNDKYEEVNKSIQRIQISCICTYGFHHSGIEAGGASGCALALPLNLDDAIICCIQTKGAGLA